MPEDVALREVYANVETDDVDAEFELQARIWNLLVTRRANDANDNTNRLTLKSDGYSRSTEKSEAS